VKYKARNYLISKLSPTNQIIYLVSKTRVIFLYISSTTSVCYLDNHLNIPLFLLLNHCTSPNKQSYQTCGTLAFIHELWHKFVFNQNPESYINKFKNVKKKIKHLVNF